MIVLDVHSVHSKRALSALMELPAPAMDAPSALMDGVMRVPQMHSVHPSKNLPWASASRFHARQFQDRESQRAAIAIEMLPHLEAEAEKRMTVGKSDPSVFSHKGRAAAVAGTRVGVGETLVQRAKKIKKANAKLFERVKAGEVDVELEGAGSNAAEVEAETRGAPFFC